MRLILSLSFVLAACTGGDATAPRQTQAFDAIGPQELVRFVGTEPFWGGEVRGTDLTYSTIDNSEGTRIAVERFAGNNGLSFSGRYEGAPFDMMVTPGDCSDGMSDRRYPFVVTLKLGEGQVLRGCAWSDGMPFEGPEAP